MGEIHDPQPGLLILAGFSRYSAALSWARDEAANAWGPVGVTSDSFDFVETDYYEATMGPGLKKIFFAFENLIDPEQLAELKRQTNCWEDTYAKMASHPEPRPLNLDPGYITLGKLVLASTKDHAHRIYLSHGIYAEVTLQYQDRRWRRHEWTFPDYRRVDYQAFFSQCRDYLRRRQREGGFV